MKKKELTYQEIELLLFTLKEQMGDLYMSESMEKKINELYMKLIGMRAQMEYFKLRESETK